jgi:acylphosphatase
MPRIKFEVTGQVQGAVKHKRKLTIGVFFRVHAIKKATSLGVTGWIRNSKHGGSVEGEAQNKEQQPLDEFVKVGCP